MAVSGPMACSVAAGCGWLFRLRPSARRRADDLRHAKRPADLDQLTALTNILPLRQDCQTQPCSGTAVHDDRVLATRGAPWGCDSRELTAVPPVIPAHRGCNTRPRRLRRCRQLSSHRCTPEVGIMTDLVVDHSSELPDLQGWARAWARSARSSGTSAPSRTAARASSTTELRAWRGHAVAPRGGRR